MTRNALASIAAPLTVAGRVLLHEHSSGTPHMARHILAIEAEARTLADEGLAGDGLREAAQAVADEWSHPDGPSHGEMKDRMYALRAALDKETPKQTFSLPSNTIKES